MAYLDRYVAYSTRLLYAYRGAGGEVAGGREIPAVIRALWGFRRSVLERDLGQSPTTRTRTTPVRCTGTMHRELYRGIYFGKYSSRRLCGGHEVKLSPVDKSGAGGEGRRGHGGPYRGVAPLFLVRVAYSALIAGPYHDSIWPPTEHPTVYRREKRARSCQENAEQRRPRRRR